MMQPVDPLSQLALCCGFGGRRRGLSGGYKARNYFYSPSTTLLDAGNSGWPMPNHYMTNQPQPYFLLTQPVIIAGNPAQHPNTTMTLVQPAQTGPNASSFSTLSVVGTQPHAIQPSIVSSQYAIYNTSAALNTSIVTAPTLPVCDPQQLSLNRNQSSYILNNRSPMLPLMEEPSTATTQQQPERAKAVTLNSEVFRQLELIEKQVDLSKDMNLVERHNIVITRALDPYSLMPYLSESTLKRYHSHFLNSHKYVIRFIEVIKRPGQTLGLYIRTVQFEGSSNQAPRTGLVITKIDHDSPIYNSPVLHVGDEIISVNLVDVQGMSLDDVVVIMSIPKRLVLAIRIPKDRDHLLNINLQQQHQQMTFGNLDHRDDTEATGYHPQRAQVEDHLIRQQASIGEFSIQGRDPSFQSRMSRLGELKRDTSRGIMHQEQDIKLESRPVRAHSALRIDETYADMPTENRYTNYGDDIATNFGSRPGPWPVQSLDRGSFMGRSARPIMIDHHEQRQVLIENVNQQSSAIKPRESYNEDICAVVGDSSRFPNFDLSTDLKTLENAVLNEERSSRAENSRQIPNYNAETNFTSTSDPMPSTLPRRTLPTRPISLSSPTTSIKQPVISNLRLADTPEQSSYFSSSIDAINRELKELRRQRMALSNNENSIDSARADF